MLFSSVTFLYYFFPCVLLFFFLMPRAREKTSARNCVLLIASLVFYAWGEPVYLLLMLFQSFSGWGFGLLIERYRATRLRRVFLVLSLIVGFSGLAYFKYAGFFADNLNALLPALSLPALHIALPVGISFYTFQILSYDIDLYRGSCGVQRNYFTFTTYVSLFPQLIAGPIVRYVDVERELTERA
ncbi:MAG: MBOAT family protein, partial [Oscillospiraceae bacterium]|nr:MBOAT family protein [Oscillospiraceae bacterium]